ncbi:MAG TPA: serine/threonine protein kinase, partial [Chroococcales cyanobacterium]
MEITDVKVFPITESSQISDARRQIVLQAFSAGLNEKAQDRTALICTELGTNLIKHTAHGGELIAQIITDGDLIGLDIFSMDNGGGMDAKRCMVDGYSSAGTLGNGLGAVQRLSDEFNMNSSPKVGTVIQARVWNPP